MSNVLKCKFYTRDLLREYPDYLFVFGDNMDRKGYGGQALACRGEPNAVGIPTKRSPTMADHAFFTDEDADVIIPVIENEFSKLFKHVANGKKVVWPEDGIGTGLAQLPERAPTIYAYIMKRLSELEAYNVGD